MYKESALNHLGNIDPINNFNNTNKIIVNIFSLSTILSQHVNERKLIDLLGIDVEGNELRILESNNWEKYRPTIIIVELLRNQNKNNNDLIKFLSNHNYAILSILYNSYVFKTNLDNV